MKKNELILFVIIVVPFILFFIFNKNLKGGKNNIFCTTKITCNVDTLKPKKIKKIIYKIDNEKISSFSYYKNDGAPDEGASAIAIYKNFAFISDMFHSNIKRIDLNTEELIYSEHLSDNEKPISIGDIAVFNDKVFAIGDYISVKILSLDLKLEKTIFNVNGTHKIVFKTDSNAIYILNENKQLKDLSINFEILQINKLNEVKNTIINYSIEDYREWKLKQKIKGKEYEIIENGNNIFLKNIYGIFKLNETIPHVKYRAINLDFTNNRIIFFDSTPEELTIFSYEY